jgi:glycosyltransferase involved in cell wall biosynthesis
MRIGFLCSNIYNSGGTERISIALANQLAASGHEVFFFSLYSGERVFYPLAESITIRTLLERNQKLVFHYPRLILILHKFFKIYNIDIVVDVVVSLSLISIPARIFRPTKIISWEHFNFFVNLNTKAMTLGRRVAARYSDAIVTLTDGDRQAYLDNLRVNARILTIPNFLPMKIEKTAPLDGNVVLAVGRLTYQKGYDTLLKIWKRVFESGLRSNWILRIVGNGEDEGKLRAQAKEAGLENHVEFISETKGIEQEYLAASVFVVSSRWEGLPMVMIEAKSFGLPIISFDCLTGPRDLIKHGEDGILVRDQDIESFALELKNLLNDKERIISMGKRARINAKSYEMDNIMSRWNDLLESLSKH